MKPCPASLLLALSLAIGVAACDSFAGLYEGPPPSQSAIQDELAIAVRVNASIPGEVSFVLDRLTYRSDDPDSVDRAIIARDTALASWTHVAVGDTVRFSSEFMEVMESPRLNEVPDWEMNAYWAPPIAVHALSAIEAAAAR